VRINESCVVGADRTYVSVRVTGVNANEQCAALIARSGGAGYLNQANVRVAGPVICQLRVGSNVFTVRDRDATQTIGRALCGALAAL